VDGKTGQNEHSRETFWPVAESVKLEVRCDKALSGNLSNVILQSTKKKNKKKKQPVREAHFVITLLKMELNTNPTIP
jgi:hypothetical protein